MPGTCLKCSTRRVAKVWPLISRQVNEVHLRLRLWTVNYASRRKNVPLSILTLRILDKLSRIKRIPEKKLVTRIRTSSTNYRAFAADVGTNLRQTCETDRSVPHDKCSLPGQGSESDSVGHNATLKRCEKNFSEAWHLSVPKPELRKKNYDVRTSGWTVPTV